MNRTRTSADIANTMSQNDLGRLNSFMSSAGQAEGSRQSRQTAALNATAGMSRQVQDLVSNALANFDQGGQADWENYATTQLAPKLQAYGMDQKQIDELTQTLGSVFAASTRKGG
jgi:hypothetical protein